MSTNCIVLYVYYTILNCIVLYVPNFKDPHLLLLCSLLIHWTTSHTLVAAFLSFVCSLALPSSFRCGKPCPYHACMSYNRLISVNRELISSCSSNVQKRADHEASQLCSPQSLHCSCLGTAPVPHWNTDGNSQCCEGQQNLYFF